MFQISRAPTSQLYSLCLSWWQQQCPCWACFLTALEEWKKWFQQVSKRKINEKLTLFHSYEQYVINLKMCYYLMLMCLQYLWVSLTVTQIQFLWFEFWQWCYFWICMFNSNVTDQWKQWTALKIYVTEWSCTLTHSLCTGPTQCGFEHYWQCSQNPPYSLPVCRAFVLFCMLPVKRNKITNE